ncbi:MAG: diguanylate cyclase [Acidobacteria bacterium]|nr:diguanylate cyclase [Acidobacteriota bacterium]
MKVLIADDELVSRRLLQSMLVRLGYEVVVASDGVEAQTILLAPDGPRLAILDWMMPGADGLAVCRTIREQAPAYVYVIVLTSKDRKEDLVAAFDAEVDDFITKPYEPVELRARLRSGERVLALQATLLETQAMLQQQATHDSLTGLWNRGMIHEQLGRELKRAARSGEPVAVIMADLDHFKQINDRYGHAAGDEVLRQASARMRGVLRDHDGISRYGGEEFLVLLPQTGIDAALAIAERVRTAITSQPVVIGDQSLPVTLSMGLATTAEHPAEVDPLIAAADAALYRAKAAGRNRVER